jgi:hypothetical protein
MKTINKLNKTNKMKKLGLILLLIIAPMIVLSQSVFEKYEDMDDVSTAVVTKHAFKLMGKVGGDSKEVREYKDMIMNLNNLAVYSTESKSIALKMRGDVKAFLKSSKMYELFRVKDKDANVKIFAREGRDEDHISELFMFVDGLNSSVSLDGRNPKAVIVSLTGNIDLNKISELTDKLNIPGGEHLKGKKN